jgi:uncharacterized protein (DUF362 family)
LHSTVYLIESEDRYSGIPSLIKACNLPDFSGKRVILKANFNSADPFPASTHHDTLRALVEEIRTMGADTVVLMERSGMGDTRQVLEERGVFALAGEMGFEVIILDDVPGEEWNHIPAPGSHWPAGFYLPAAIMSGSPVIQTCCLKTHRFGGHFTMSLKNSVGLVARRVPGSGHDFMQDLHRSPDQRMMIAEINRFFPVDLVIMDAVEGFARGGPEQGERITPQLILASRDRVAIDAVGVAILRRFGTTPDVSKGRIFGLGQIARAAQLGIGVSRPEEISIIPVDKQSNRWSETIREIVDREG